MGGFFFGDARVDSGGRAALKLIEPADPEGDIRRTLRRMTDEELATEQRLVGDELLFRARTRKVASWRVLLIAKFSLWLARLAAPRRVSR